MGKQGYEQVGVAMTCRGYDEYVRMFDLQPVDLERGEMLDVAAGGSSFTADANARGYRAFAVDPRYDKGIEEWISEAEQEIETSTAKLAKLQERFDWSYYGSIDQHRAGRVTSIERFKESVRDSMNKHRYAAGKLPELPYSDNRFSLILCSHFMFLYADQFGTEFHIEAMKELMRICKPGGQIRIYPLLSLNWEPYPGLEQLLHTIKENGGSAELCPSHLPFIPGSSQYLKVSL
ncbi:SAM-dependent methyltransferase [Paenibacillus endophyticus]|uniref:SAM-dependent methyltransferase n=1 Tax=Paenibacillus endophyticus TaxID=1294268 RepID=A0A7W5G922_9BACL|nr:methyltransferase domain-containing protein [Paenibacillus endophyticus]MBB3151211.1 SAM-dependent methyltransferase [Paenibacillus endophyticus]